MNLYFSWDQHVGNLEAASAGAASEKSKEALHVSRYSHASGARYPGSKPTVCRGLCRITYIVVPASL